MTINPSVVHSAWFHYVSDWVNFSPGARAFNRASFANILRSVALKFFLARMDLESQDLLVPFRAGTVFYWHELSAHLPGGCDMRCFW